MEGTKGAEEMDVTVHDWAEEVGEEMEAVAGPDRPEREKQLALKLLALDVLETQGNERAHWGIQQWVGLGKLIDRRGKEIREVRTAVDGMAQQLTALAAAQPLGDAKESVATRRPAPAPTLRPAAVPAPAARVEPEQRAVPRAAHKPAGSAQQQRRRAAVDRARAEKEKEGREKGKAVPEPETMEGRWKRPGEDKLPKTVSDGGTQLQRSR